MQFFAGLDYSKKDNVFILDGDLQDPPELVEEFLKKKSDGYDVVYGIRKKERPLY